MYIAQKVRKKRRVKTSQMRWWSYTVISILYRTAQYTSSPFLPYTPGSDCVLYCDPSVLVNRSCTVQCLSCHSCVGQVGACNSFPMPNIRYMPWDESDIQQIHIHRVISPVASLDTVNPSHIHSRSSTSLLNRYS